MKQISEEGTIRNAEWNALSTGAKLLSLRERRGESKKQIAKLEAQSA